MSLAPYTTEITLAVEVEVLSAERAEPGRYAERPERCAPGETAYVELAVRLGTLDITAALPGAMFDALADEALERLQDAADEALLP